MDRVLLKKAKRVLHSLKEHDFTLASAESCTAGIIGTALAAASDGGAHYASGFITYNDSAKATMLSVKPDTLRNFSAVSAQAVREMAQGASHAAGTRTALAVSGYAGPDGGADGTPAGTVWFAWYLGEEQTHVEKKYFTGECEEVVQSAAYYALERLACLLDEII